MSTARDTPTTILKSDNIYYPRMDPKLLIINSRPRICYWEGMTKRKFIWLTLVLLANIGKDMISKDDV